MNGAAECVGSDSRKVVELIETERRTSPAAAVEIDISSRDDDLLSVGVTAKSLGSRGRGALILALFETRLVTPVSNGENGGRTLRNDYVVRRLQEIAFLEPEETLRREARLEIDPAWRDSKLGLAAFVQQRDTLAIVGASVLPAGALKSSR